jgi:hypothetical protein
MYVHNDPIFDLSAMIGWYLRYILLFMIPLHPNQGSKIVQSKFRVTEDEIILRKPTSVGFERRSLSDEGIPSQYMNGNGSADVLAKGDIFLARKIGYEVMNLIYQRYEFHNKHWLQFFFGSFNMPTTAWDIIKYKVAYKAMKKIGKLADKALIYR